MKLYFVVLLISSITSPYILGYPAGPFEIPKYWSRGVWLNRDASGDKERTKRETLTMIPNIPNDHLPHEPRMELDKSPQLSKSNIDELLLSLGIEHVTRRDIVESKVDKMPPHFPSNSRNEFNPFTPFHMESKDEPKPFSPFSVDSKRRQSPFLPFSMDLESKPKPFSKFAIESNNKIHSYQHFPMDTFDRSPFSSNPRQSPFDPFPIEPKIRQHPFSPFPIMSKHNRYPFSPLPLRSFPHFPQRNFESRSRSSPLTLDDSPIIIEIVNDSGLENGLDTKLQSILKKISKAKSQTKDQENQNSSESSSEEEDGDVKPCPREENQIKPEHGVCIMTVLGLLILIPLITTCLIKKYNPLPAKKTEPV